MTPPEQPPDAARPVTTLTPERAFSSERWRVIQRVVDGALDLPPAARAAYLDEACGGDAALR